jgi:hypothetical protein
MERERRRTDLFLTEGDDSFHSTVELLLTVPIDLPSQIIDMSKVCDDMGADIVASLLILLKDMFATRGRDSSERAEEVSGKQENHTRETERDRDRDRERQRQRQRETETETERDRERGRE